MTRQSTQWPIPLLAVNIQNCRPDNGSSLNCKEIDALAQQYSFYEET